MIWLAVLFASCSALLVALSTSVQHRAAGEAPQDVGGSARLLLHLAGRPWWLFGQLLGFGGLVLHALALKHGPIAVVQPIGIMGIVLAPPIRAALSRSLMARKEALAVLLTGGGLVCFLVTTRPAVGHAEGGVLPFVLGAVVALAATAVLLAARRVHTLQLRSFLLGAAAGLVFGLVAVTLKISMQALNDGGWVGFLTSGATYAAVTAGLVGVAVNQSAYRAARLSASMPVLTIVDVGVALLFGYVVFHEVPVRTPLALVVSAVCAVAIGYGLWVLARYREEHRDEDESALAGRGTLS